MTTTFSNGMTSIFVGDGNSGEMTRPQYGFGLRVTASAKGKKNTGNASN
jgi:hypothetical protein